MKSPSTCIIAVTFLAILATPSLLDEQQRRSNELPRYAVIDLGTLGGTFSVAAGINHKGWVTGNATLPDDTALHAFLRQDETNTDLETLGGTNSRGDGTGVAQMALLTQPLW